MTTLSRGKIDRDTPIGLSYILSFLIFSRNDRGFLYQAYGLFIQFFNATAFDDLNIMWLAIFVDICSD